MCFLVLLWIHEYAVRVADTYHAAANVHTTIRLIDNRAKYNVLSQIGVRNVRLEKNKCKNKYQNEAIRLVSLQFGCVMICNDVSQRLMNSIGKSFV